MPVLHLHIPDHQYYGLDPQRTHVCLLQGFPESSSDEQLTVGTDRDGPHDKCARELLNLIPDNVPTLPQY